jgi:hypothetical protein
VSSTHPHRYTPGASVTMSAEILQELVHAIKVSSEIRTELTAVRRAVEDMSLKLNGVDAIDRRLEKLEDARTGDEKRIRSVVGVVTTMAAALVAAIGTVLAQLLRGG